VAISRIPALVNQAVVGMFSEAVEHLIASDGLDGVTVARTAAGR
jgi:hypothetical protein